MDNLIPWDDVDRELNAQAREAGIHSARHAEFHEALDELGAPSTLEALAWASREHDDEIAGQLADELAVRQERAA